MTRLVSLLFGTTLFVSAWLLFLVQPMIAKMVLPLLGGTPAVWNTCMLFFQALLLGGYVYAHTAPARSEAPLPKVAHVTMLALPLLVLPIAVAGAPLPPVEANPIPWLLTVLLLSAGAPFLAVSTSAPLLQQWFAQTRHPAAKDPYFLYGASNLGSIVALLSYPTIVEPYLRLGAQARVWAGGYALLVILTGACAACTWLWGRSSAVGGRRPGNENATRPGYEDRDGPGVEGSSDRPPFLRRLRWLALAFVPSSLMLGVTTYLTTDIAAIPLLWIMPLALYLLTFVLTFANVLGTATSWLDRRLRVWLPVLVLVLLYCMWIRLTLVIAANVAMHLAAFFMAAMVCHGQLARSRPPARHLTEFYLWMSLGGVLGGVFNAVVAPQLFRTVAEYPLMMIAALLFLPPRAQAVERTLDRQRDLWFPLALGGLTAAVLMVSPARRLDATPVSLLVTYGLLAAVCFTFVTRPTRFALGLAAIVAVNSLLGYQPENVLHRERSFFGVLLVRLDAEGKYRQLVHGNTLHGQQSVDPARHDEPLTYYHRAGPIGWVFTAFEGEAAKPRVALVGLGTGSLASYGEPGQELTFYEIDPAVERLARDPAYFTYLRDSRATVQVILGDARLRLAHAPDGHYGMIVIDAFSSDAIPVHLLTREALRLYLAKLDPNGLLALHVSNRYLHLEPALHELAVDAGLQGLIAHDKDGDEEGKTASSWALLARHDEDFGPLVDDTRWRRLRGRADGAVWTDDFSNLLSVVNWRGSLAE